jgi:hypothetical protein
MPLDYDTPTPSTVSTHDQIYTTLLGVLGFFLLVGMVGLGFIAFFPTTTNDGRVGIMMVLATEGLFFVAILIVFLIRIIYPAHRRWPTVGMNIILLPIIPFGTALGVYGFWKVDKKLGAMA